MSYFLLIPLWILYLLVWKEAPALVIIAGLAVAVFIINSIIDKNAKEKDHEMMLEKMSPDERLEYEQKKQEDIKRLIFGSINPHLICPHCQTKGTVHATKKIKEIVSTGQIGGILKTNTKSTITDNYTQHHCAQCNTTWSV